MIALRLNIQMEPLSEPVVVRLRKDSQPDKLSSLGYDAIYKYQSGKWAAFEINGLELRVETDSVELLHNDVLMILPSSKLGHRLIRADSEHNSFLITEQCDQVCIMCSQPPKKHHADLFDCFLEAACLAPAEVTIGITGGEPMLHKERLFDFLNRVFERRPDIKFHILTNGQHFDKEDQEFLSSEISKNVLWAIPIYSDEEDKHDLIVGKQGAFQRLIDSLLIFSKTTAMLELRTVVLNSNLKNLARLANFVTSNVPFAEFLSIMQLEPIGFGRKVWRDEFVDTSVNFAEIARAVNIATARAMPVYLYNFPLCTIPREFQKFTVKSVSDWKQKYLDICEGCNSKAECGGFFEWYKEKEGYKELAVQ